MAKFTKNELQSLKTLADSVKAKDRLGEGKCAPTGDRYVERVEKLKEHVEHAKNDERMKRLVPMEKKFLHNSIANTLKYVQDFDKYWAEHKKEIIAECDKAAKLLDKIKI